MAGAVRSATTTLAAAEPLPGRARLVIVFVVDGLRPDAIDADETPTLFRLRREGVNFVNGHAVFPTVTRVNAAALSTGTYPGTNGINSNQMYVPAVRPGQAFDTGDFKNLLALDRVTGGRLVPPTLAERLHAAGRSLAAVSSGSSGSAFLLNPRAPQGVGVLVSGHLEPGVRVGYPDKVSAEVLARFGAAPVRGGAGDSYDPSVDWAQTVLREYVLPEVRPDVVVNWLTEPDHIQHARSAGSPEARRAIRNDDRHIGLILNQIEALGLADRTDLFVVSDHGFSLNVHGVNVTRELIAAGLKAAADSDDDVVIASSGQSVLVHVKERDRERIRRIVDWLHAREWTGVVFTAGRARTTPVEPHGWAEGTFSLELIHAANDERGPDVVFTFPWTSAPNAFGVPGADYGVTGGDTGPTTGARSDHGSMSPWTVRNTFLAWGIDFKRGATVRTPASNVDIAPTVLALLGVEARGLDGRVLLEALRGGSDEEQVVVETRVFTTSRGDGYAAAIQVSETPGQRYIDKSWRVR